MTMVWFNRKKKAKKSLGCICDNNCEVMDAEIAEIGSQDKKRKNRTHEIIKNLGLRMREAPCPCSTRRNNPGSETR